MQHRHAHFEVFKELVICDHVRSTVTDMSVSIDKSKVHRIVLRTLHAKLRLQYE